METFLGGVGVAALGGLAFLAYHHKEFFKRLSSPLFFITLGAQLVSAAYEIGRIQGWSDAYSQAAKAASGAAESSKALEALLKIERPAGLPTTWISIGTFAFMVYLAVLSFLPAPPTKDT